MKHTITLDEIDIKKMIIRDIINNTELKVVKEPTIIITPGYEGNQFDRSDPSVKVEVEVE